MPQPRENPVPCQGLHPMKYRPTTFAVDGFCSDRCRNQAAADKAAIRETRIAKREANDRARDLSESMR